MVTAIIVNYHSRSLTARAVASVLADQPDAQVIVIDNSEDAFEAAELAQLLPGQVECVVSPENIGFGRACNIGYDRARYDWVFLLNPDAFVIPGCIAELVAFLRRTPRAGAVSPFVYWDNGLAWFASLILMHTPLTGFGMDILLRRPWLGSLASRLFRRWAIRRLQSRGPVERAMLSGGQIMVRKAAVEAAGGLFDPHFFLYFEDTDLCRRLSQTGWRLYLLPDAQVVHEWEPVKGSGEISAASRRHYLAKHFPDSWLVALQHRLGSRLGPIRLPACVVELGDCTTSPVLPVPEALREAWLLEFSPQALLMPAIYYFGNSSEIQIPEPLWQRLGPGDYWVRIGALDGSSLQWFHFRIV